MVNVGVRILAPTLAVLAVGCGQQAGSAWHQVTSPLGDYVIEFPGEPTTFPLTDARTNRTFQAITSDYEDITYSMFERPLDGVPPMHLDEAVDGSMEFVRANTPPSSAAPVRATQVSRTTGDFDGAETRKFVFELINGNTRALVSSLMFYRNDTVVQAMVVSNDETESGSVDRFLSSLKPTSG